MDTPVSPVTLITGGSRGLGRNAAIHLARAGHDLILTYRSKAAEAEAAAAELQALGRRVAVLPLDVADSGSFAAFAARVREVLAGWSRQQFDALVNNAGTGLHVP
ncbi:MAG: SDR family NAD(P)-dependent oxidoreductase, partial [Lysobacteraceae bacterium]